jgi:hypothetical protein
MRDKSCFDTLSAACYASSKHTWRPGTQWFILQSRLVVHVSIVRLYHAMSDALDADLITSM